MATAAQRPRNSGTTQSGAAAAKGRCTSTRLPQGNQMKTFVERPESVGSASLLRSTHQPVGTSSCTSDSSFVRLRSFRDEQLKLRSPRTELPLQAWRRSSLRQIRLRATMSPTLARRRRRTQQRRTALPYCCPSGVNDSHDHSKPLANKLRRSLPRGLDLLASHQESGDLEKSVVEAVAAAATAASRTGRER